MSLLSLIRTAARRCGVGRPTVAMAATDDLTGLLVDLAQDSVEEIARRHGWRALRVPGQSFTTVAAALQPNTLPADYERMAPGRSVWNTTMRRPLVGPASADAWATLNGRGMPAGLDLVYRLGASGFSLYPTPPAGQTITFEYVTRNRVVAVDGVTKKPAFTADDDVPLVPEHLVWKAVVWRFKESKGLDYAEAMRTFERDYELEAAADRGETEIATAIGGTGLSSLDELPPDYWPGQLG